MDKFNKKNQNETLVHSEHTVVVRYAKCGHPDHSLGIFISYQDQFPGSVWQRKLSLLQVTEELS